MTESWGGGAAVVSVDLSQNEVEDKYQQTGTQAILWNLGPYTGRTEKYF